tara:strand:- start:1058 stop:1726 length:669 start_codon:yes stop_codon:yes gene_type:complete
MFGQIEKYREIYQKNRTVTITDLFTEEIANQIWEDYKSHEGFQTSFFTGEPDESGDTPLRFAEKGSSNYTLWTERVNEMMANNEFSYRFSRTNWWHQELVKLWESKMFIAGLSYITDNEQELVWNADSTFTSKYEEGDFLSIHTDENHGRVAFVYQITKDWLPQNGGLFQRLPDWKNIDKTVVPQFNQLTLFDVSGPGVPHMVTSIANGVKNIRMGYSGWFV